MYCQLPVFCQNVIASVSGLQTANLGTTYGPIRKVEPRAWWIAYAVRVYYESLKTRFDFQRSYKKPSMSECSIPDTQGQGQVNLCEFKANQVCIISPRSAKAVLWDPVLKKEKEKQASKQAGMHACISFLISNLRAGAETAGCLDSLTIYSLSL